MTAPASIYPREIEELLPYAIEYAEHLDAQGEQVSRNQLMKQFRIGAPKAKALLEALEDRDAEDPWTRAEPVDPDPDPEVGLDPDAESPEPEPVAVAPVSPAPAQPPAPRRPTPRPAPATDAGPGPAPAPTAVRTLPQTAVDGHPGTIMEPTALAPAPAKRRPVRSWPVFLISLPAAVAIWSGWVGLGSLTGFGVVHPLPGIWDEFALNTAITLPIGVEAYAAYALRVWLSGSRVPVRARRFARWSAILALVVGSAGQVAYHLMESAGMEAAPWQITTAVSCLPVVVLGMGAALAHLLHADDEN